MRFLMKRIYYEDIRLFKYRSTFFWYLALVIGCFLLPVILDDYLLSQLTRGPFMRISPSSAILI